MKECNYCNLSQLIAMKHAQTDGESFRSGVRDVLEQMSNAPEIFSEELNKSNESFLETIEDHILNAKEFTVGVFKNSYPAWEELLRESKRQSSKKIMKWIREGVKPIFKGVQNTEPAKLNRVRGLLRHTVPKGQVEVLLKGVLSHEISSRIASWYTIIGTSW
jgi:hypothetical protein